MVFRVKKNVRFSHCDPAGIVFYPRYAELCNEVVEDWFRDALGVSFHTLQEELNLTLPVVRLEIEFLAPSTYREALDFTLGVKAIGNTSIQLEIIAWHGEQQRICAQIKSVMVSLNDLRPLRISEEWRARLTPYMH